MKKFIGILVMAITFACTTSNQQSDSSNTGKEASSTVELKDFGGTPLVIDIEDHTLQNESFRTAIWTGEFMQLTVMSIPVGGEVGLEVHDDIEQFLRIESGKGKVMMGDTEDNLDVMRSVDDDDVILVPVGKWHNIINIGDKPLKLYSIYAKPEHPFGTIHVDKNASDADEHHH